MTGWVLWAVVACVFGIGQRLTSSFFIGSLAIAALAAAVASTALGGVVGWIVFVAVALLALLLVRPVVRSRRRGPSQIRAGAAALVGKEAIVLEAIANREGVGCVRIEGQLWTARSLHDDEVIERGARVEVVDVKGATALVTEYV
jgi:membrane protein implicated in regulation of membrane protease activity